jgi:hypothetical protein
MLFTMTDKKNLPPKAPISNSSDKTLEDPSAFASNV